VGGRGFRAAIARQLLADRDGNFPSMDIKHGSMRRPLPGVEAAIVRRKADGSVEVVAAFGEEGELALRSGWPSMMRGYLHEEARYKKCFANGWCLTSDRPAHTGDAGADQRLDADDTEVKADQDRREGRHSRRYAAFQMAEVAIPRDLLVDILRIIAELRPPPLASTT
jgi:acyl-CoA synthetase (AMP-forming)/AMP-acid ligase II